MNATWAHGLCVRCGETARISLRQKCHVGVTHDYHLSSKISGMVRCSTCPLAFFPASLNRSVELRTRGVHCYVMRVLVELEYTLPTGVTPHHEWIPRGGGSSGDLCLESMPEDSSEAGAQILHAPTRDVENASHPPPKRRKMVDLDGSTQKDTGRVENGADDRDHQDTLVQEEDEDSREACTLRVAMRQQEH